jgi:hypothetical protein
MLFVLFYVVLIGLVIAAKWAIFVKAGEPGWAAIVPIYDTIVLLRIVGKPEWWVILIYFVPCVNLVIILIVFVELAKVFGKSGGFAVGLIFLGIIFWPMLAWGDAQYIGPDNAGTRNRRRSVSRFDDDEDEEDDDRPRRRDRRDDDDENEDDRPRRR